MARTTTEACGVHADPTLYWDQNSIRHPLRRDHFIVWITDPQQPALLQTQPLNIPWDGFRCIRCTFLAMTTFPDTNAVKGPYMIRPTPNSLGSMMAAHFIVLTSPKIDIQMALRLSIHSPSGTRSGTLVLVTLNGITSVPAVFDAAKPDHRCRSSTWCRIRRTTATQSFISWWPATISVADFSHMELDEFDPGPSGVLIGMAQPPMQQHASQQTCPDPGATTYHTEGDESSAIAISSIKKPTLRTLDTIPGPDRRRSIVSFLPYGCNTVTAHTRNWRPEGRNQQDLATDRAADEILTHDYEVRSTYHEMPQEHYNFVPFVTERLSDVNRVQDELTSHKQTDVDKSHDTYDPNDSEELVLMHMPRPDADRSRSRSPTKDSTTEDHETDSATSCSTDSLSALVVFGKQIERVIIPIATGTSADLFRTICARHFALQPGSEAWEALSLHPVQPRPSDTAPCVTPVIARFRGEHSLETSFALVDIELHSNLPRHCESSLSDPFLEREIWELPVAITRPVLIHALGLSELCRSIALPCIVLYGSHIWHMQDNMPYPVLDGLLIQVKVPVPEPEFPLVFYLEYARAGVSFANMLEH